VNNEDKDLLQIGVFMAGLSLLIGYVFIKMLITDAPNHDHLSQFGSSRFYFLIFSFFAVGIASIIVAIKPVWAARYLILFRHRPRLNRF
jgi:hypothetical protein